MNDFISDLLLGWADDSLILGHRNSEWAGHAPILEEDIAFANLALDELGHAQLWYGLVQELTGAEPDRLVFFRSAADWRNTQLVELPKGDWAFSILRQYLFDVYENVLLEELTTSKDARIAEIALKIKSEELYHLRHTSNRVTRLGLGTDESHARMQRALDEMWVYALQLFVPIEGQEELVRERVVPSFVAVQQAWLTQVTTLVTASGLTVPDARKPVTFSRRDHTKHLEELLADMQQVARTENYGVEW